MEYDKPAEEIEKDWVLKGLAPNLTCRVQPQCPHSGPAFSASGCTCMGVGLKQGGKRLCVLGFSFSSCSFLSGAFKRDRFKSRDISRVFGASTALPFHMAHFLLPIRREKYGKSGNAVQKAGEKSRKEWKKVANGGTNGERNRSTPHTKMNQNTENSDLHKEVSSCEFLIGIAVRRMPGEKRMKA